ncbi:hypothetical protein V1279_005131 [Bradyrhizobium sp. AZCC 1610]
MFRERAIQKLARPIIAKTFAELIDYGTGERAARKRAACENYLSRHGLSQVNIAHWTRAHEQPSMTSECVVEKSVPGPPLSQKRELRVR